MKKVDNICKRKKNIASRTHTVALTVLLGAFFIIMGVALYEVAEYEDHHNHQVLGGPGDEGQRTADDSDDGPVMVTGYASGSDPYSIEIGTFGIHRDGGGLPV